MNIPLGYEIGSGRRVAIPVNHTVVLGQTQLSGKTTTLEAMVTRSGLRAVGFITKPGEKSFRQQTQIPAFFSESSIEDYWKYVVSIVENLMSVKLGWQERGWIVKLCQDYADKTKAKAYKWKRPKTLKELLANVRIALPHLRGTAEMICMQLQEYLDSVVREIGHTEFSAKLDLETGINVMDVTELSDGLKALVIRSVIEWVHRHGRRIVVIIPEAWKFIPEGRSTPVKLALEGLIREGAGVGNFVWMDSQDLRGVDKLLLRSVIVWLFGVQRQKNEVASTLASIPDHPKPTATEIMQLGKGEFYVCYGTTLVRTYVQPAGMEDAHAQAIARGDESPDSWRQISKALDEESVEAILPAPGSGCSDDEMRVSPPVSPSHRDGESLRSHVHGASESEPDVQAAEDRESDSASNHDGELREDDAMWKEKYEVLEAEHKTLIEAHDALAKEVGRLRKIIEARSSVEPQGRGSTAGEGDSKPLRAGAPSQSSFDPEGPSNGNFDALYARIINKARQDPGILELLARQAELRVTVERQTIELDSGTLRGALALLISEKFFDGARKFDETRKELIRRGLLSSKAPNLQISLALQGLVTLGFLTKEDTGYESVAGMKIHIVEAGKAADAG